MQPTERSLPSPAPAIRPSAADRSFPVENQRWTPRQWGVLIVVGGAMCLDALDVSMVGVALPSIRTALGLSTSSLQWIVSGYVLGYGGLLLLGGPAADLLRRRGGFPLPLAGFALGRPSPLRPACRCSPRRSPRVRCGTARSASTPSSARAVSRWGWCCPAFSPRS